MVWRGIGVSCIEVSVVPSLLALPSLPANRGRVTSREGAFPRHCGVLGRVGSLSHRNTPLLPLLPSLPAIALLLAMMTQRAGEGEHLGVLARDSGLLADF